MQIDEALEFWKSRYNITKDYNDIHWEASERREHEEYVEALKIAIEALEKVKIMKIEKELKELLTKVCPPDIKPTRCIDPVIKFCQECHWGWRKYPDWVETSEDLCGCTFESGCALGFDKGRPEDEPTAQEIEEFERWYNNAEFTSC